MIDRRKFVSVVALGALTTRQGARAQQPAKVWRIGFLRLGVLAVLLGLTIPQSLLLRADEVIQ